MVIPLLECWQTVRLLGAVMSLLSLVMAIALAVVIRWWLSDHRELLERLEELDELVGRVRAGVSRPRR